MKRVVVIGSVLGALAAACGGDGGDGGGSGSEGSLAEALTTGVEFENGVLRSRLMPESDDGGERVRLAFESATLRLQPGQESTMTLDVENPDEDDQPLASLLLQFEGSKSHIEVPRGDNVSGADAGAGDLHVELPFSVAADICEQLCDRRHASVLIMAVTLEDGSVSRHEERVIELDCRQDGDPDRCDGERSEPPPDAGSEPTDGAAPVQDSGAGGEPDASADAGTGDAGEAAAAPQIGPLVPANVVAGTELTLTVAGSGFLPDAVVHVDGQAVETTYESGVALEAVVAADATADAGSLYVYVENVPGDARTRSNLLYLQVDPPSGAPTIYDYTPDNGVAGDTIRIIASNLAGQTLSIHDANGAELTPGAVSTISWPNAGTADTVEIVLPDDIATGPITIGNSLGSFRGKIFSVGSNLTRAEGTVVESSTEYNTGSWSRASGADNDLATSFFTAVGDCASLASCTTVPWYQITFADEQTVARIAFRGNREYASGYDFMRGRFEVLDSEGDVLWEGDYDLPAPDRDLDVTLSTPVANALSVRFTSLADESSEPGFSELEVFSR